MIIREISDERYGEVVGTHPGRTVFHTPAWLGVLSRAYGTRVRYLGLFDDGDLVGACPWLTTRVFGVRLHGGWLPKHSTPRLFPLFPPGTDVTVLAAFDAWVRQSRISHFQLCWPGTDPATPAGVRTEIWENHEIALACDVDSLTSLVQRKQRNRIRFAVRQGVKVHWVRDSSFPSTYRRLLASTWQERQGVAPNTPPDLFRDLLAQREELGLRVMAATHDRRVVAAIWLLCANGRCCYWDGASDYSYRMLNAAHLLQWEALRWCVRNSVRVYDMMGPVSSRKGITRFKTSLGATEVEYSMLYWQSPAMRTALAAYRWMMDSERKVVRGEPDSRAR